MHVENGAHLCLWCHESFQDQGDHIDHIRQNHFENDADCLEAIKSVES